MNSPRRHVHRITKYDPADRNDWGHYTGTLDPVSDHGPVEAAYLAAVAAFAEDDGVRHLTIREPQLGPGFTHFGLEPAVEGHGLAGLFPPDLTGYHDGATVTLPVALDLVRAMLRDNGAWCRLESEDGFTVHVGYDQYLYVGTAAPCERAVARTRATGLFPEPVDASPYDHEPDGPGSSGEQRPADEAFWARVRWCVATGRAGLLEERPVGNVTRWYRLTDDDSVEAARARLTPRAMLALWPALSPDVAAVLAGLPEEGLIELVWEDTEGRITSTIADEDDFAALTARAAGARAAAVLSMYVDERTPVLTAVLPDPDGILRARWRTDPAPGDRQWALLKTLAPGQEVTGVVTGAALVDIGGFTATLTGAAAIPPGHRITARIADVDMVREQVFLTVNPPQRPDE
ncbi:RNA-binding protein [Streptomyces sp. SP17BM10]|uniref:RNA-binding protein n=1 Tax=Streptomyces sp. SP17BM10 TaxID=3002530 RepID=UPI002E78C461|nr:RNA-binding protein [Streptomyces sp. SP17BM10]MEE1785589.1 RNA-binding protein [Streptomyces sp. SP17BM10]